MKERSSRESAEIRAGDLLRLSEKRGTPVFTAFLNEQEQLFSERFLTGKNARFLFWGGHESCTRRMLCVSTDGAEEGDFPIYPLTVAFRAGEPLTHRDFLGAFLSLGIDRAQIGDIFVCQNCAVAFCTKTARDLILDFVAKVGRTGVTIRDGVLAELPKARFEEVGVVAASLRADCIVGALSGLSREKAADFIRSGRFLLNYEECTSVSKLLNEGDILTLRGYGKFKLADGGTETKKGRIRVRLDRYD
ncbi:MAG: YlmH/Sll1252 family protein [Bacteroides sp.]|nr:YlmH/Sll1252 family protein [Eubacterium sp.]MCM1417336.1 YlmH/Sll1252 family protein [Roseburia sp.]MCM1461471.1 YlmH/Sll1252 family protein [Bacteroides sp.]